MTTPAKTPFPERMHKQAVETHTRRAANALDTITERAAILRKRLDAGASADAETARTLAEMAMHVAEHLSALEVLRDVREWDDAERNGNA